MCSKGPNENVLIAETLSLLQSHKLGFVHYFMFTALVNSEGSFAICSLYAKCIPNSWQNKLVVYVYVLEMYRLYYGKINDSSCTRSFCPKSFPRMPFLTKKNM